MPSLAKLGMMPPKIFLTLFSKTIKINLIIVLFLDFTQTKGYYTCANFLLCGSSQHKFQTRFFVRDRDCALLIQKRWPIKNQCVVDSDTLSGAELGSTNHRAV